MDCSPPGSSVHGILQARILKWVAISLSNINLRLSINYLLSTASCNALSNGGCSYSPTLSYTGPTKGEQLLVHTTASRPSSLPLLENLWLWVSGHQITPTLSWLHLSVSCFSASHPLKTVAYCFPSWLHSCQFSMTFFLSVSWPWTSPLQWDHPPLLSPLTPMVIQRTWNPDFEDPSFWHQISFPTLLL